MKYHENRKSMAKGFRTVRAFGEAINRHTIISIDNATIETEMF
jgi:hypothetical protein